MKDGTHLYRFDYILKRNRVNQVNKEAKSKTWNELGLKLADDFSNGKKLVSSSAKNYRKSGHELASKTIKDVNGIVLTDTEMINSLWKDFFEKLLNIDQDQTIDL